MDSAWKNEKTVLWKGHHRLVRARKTTRSEHRRRLRCRGLCSDLLLALFFSTHLTFCTHPS